MINLVTMCKFYGCILSVESEISEIKADMNFADVCVNALPRQINIYHARNYDQRINNIGVNEHNLLRLTRILTSLYIVGLKQYADIFYENILANIKESLDMMFAGYDGKLANFNRSFTIWTNVYRKYNH